MDERPRRAGREPLVAFNYVVLALVSGTARAARRARDCLDPHPSGQAMLGMVGVFAEFERSMIEERA